MTVPVTTSKPSSFVDHEEEEDEEEDDVTEVSAAANAQSDFSKTCFTTTATPNTNLSSTSVTETIMRCLHGIIHVVWFVLFLFVVTAGGVFATIRPKGPRNMFYIISGLFFLSSLLGSSSRHQQHVQDGSVYAAYFLFLVIPFGPIDDYGYGTESWCYIAASILLVVVFQTKSILLLVTSSRTIRTAAKSCVCCSSFLTVQILFNLMAAIIVILSMMPLGRQFFSLILWRILATLAWLTLFILVCVMIPWLVITLQRQQQHVVGGSYEEQQTLSQDDNDEDNYESNNNKNNNKTTVKILYATLTLACMVNQLTNILAFFPSD